MSNAHPEAFFLIQEDAMLEHDVFTLKLMMWFSPQLDNVETWDLGRGVWIMLVCVGSH